MHENERGGQGPRFRKTGHPGADAQGLGIRSVYLLLHYHSQAQSERIGDAQFLVRLCQSFLIVVMKMVKIFREYLFIFESDSL